MLRQCFSIVLLWLTILSPILSPAVLAQEVPVENQQNTFVAFDEETSTQSTSYIVDALKIFTQYFHSPEKLDPREMLNYALFRVAELVKMPGTTPKQWTIPSYTAKAEIIPTFHRLYNALEKYAERQGLDLSKLKYQAIQAMLASVGDSHAYFMPPDVMQRSNERLRGGDYGGIGILITAHKSGIVYVWYVIPDGPADQAGIEDFDILVKVNGEPIKDINDAAQKLRGKIGTKVALTVRRLGQEHEFLITRDKVKGSQWPFELRVYRRNGRNIIVYLALWDFRNGIVEKIKQIDPSVWTNCDGIILDLRGNGGGYLYEATELMDIFLPRFQLLYIWKNNVERIITYSMKPQKLSQPLIVMVNQVSASASEIVAGVLQEIGRAQVAGQKTLGSVSVAKIQLLNDGAGMVVPVWQFFKPSGEPIEGIGVMPDINLPDLSREDIERGVDSELEATLNELFKQLSQLSTK